MFISPIFVTCAMLVSYILILYFVLGFISISILLYIFLYVYIHFLVIIFVILRKILIFQKKYLDSQKKFCYKEFCLEHRQAHQLLRLFPFGILFFYFAYRNMQSARFIERRSRPTITQVSHFLASFLFLAYTQKLRTNLLATWISLSTSFPSTSSFYISTSAKILYYFTPLISTYLLWRSPPASTLIHGFGCIKKLSFIKPHF